MYPALRLTSADGDSVAPAIVWTGDGYFVVWADGRGGAGNDIYGVMLAPDGSRKGGMADTLLADGAGPAASPEIAPLPGGGFVVVYEDCNIAGEGALCAVNSIRVGADGQPAGTPVKVSDAVAVQRRPYVATGHDKVYVTFRDSVMVGGAARTMARLTTLDAAGAAAGPGVVVHEGSNGQYPHVAVSPTQVALVYQRENPNADIVLALFDPALTFLEEIVVRNGSMFTGDATNPVVQWNTTRWVAAWEDQRGGEAAIYATVVDPQGNIGTTQQAYDENGNWPTIASGGLMTSLIGFYGYPGQHVMLARLEADGTLKPGQVVLDTGKFPAVAYSPTGGARGMGEYAVVYQNEGVKEIYFARFECMD